jgi:serine/threonine protein phosphatase PrpC
MDCPRCNAPNRAEARFCAWCGTALISPSPAVEIPASAEPAETTMGADASPPAPEVEAPAPTDTSLTDVASPPPALETPASAEPTEMTTAANAASFTPTVETPAPTTSADASLADVAPPAPATETPASAEPTETIDTGAQPPMPGSAEREEGEVESLDSTQPSNLPSFHPSNLLPSQPASPGLEPEPAPQVSLLPPESLPPGTLLQGRFEILGMAGREGDETLYQARDRARCWQCGATDTPPGEVFCAGCGAELAAGQALCRVRETLVEPGEVEADALATLEETGRWYVVLPEEKVTEPEAMQGAMHLAVGMASHPGQVRQRDEDSLLALTLAAMVEGGHAPALGFYAVADGLGGYEGGQVASCIAVRIVADWVTRRVLLPEVMGETCLEETAVALLILAVKEANARIYQLRQTHGSEMGSTFTGALVLADKAIVVNVGDSRTYLWRNGELEQITTDHSAVARLIEVGEVQPEDIYTHPQRSTIYRSLGDKATVEADSFVRRLAPGDRLLLCCDGVWESLRPDGLQEVLLAEPDPQRAADEMIKRANLAGGEDNLSVIVVTIE